MTQDEPVVWAARGGVPVELRRLRGPRQGLIEPPAHLLETQPRGALDLDETQVKVRLYELLLSQGSAFDLYRWVNLDELMRLWDQLELTPDVAAPWAWALQSIKAASTSA